jgi:hypothetical protein
MQSHIQKNKRPEHVRAKVGLSRLHACVGRSARLHIHQCAAGRNGRVRQVGEACLGSSQRNGRPTGIQSAAQIADCDSEISQHEDKPGTRRYRSAGLDGYAPDLGLFFFSSPLLLVLCSGALIRATGEQTRRPISGQGPWRGRRGDSVSFGIPRGRLWESEASLKLSSS